MGFSTFKSSLNSLMPIFAKPRHRCPFYGFGRNDFLKALVDSKGNQCALVVNTHSCCELEFRGEAPNWDKCSFNSYRNEKILQEIGTSYKVFPEEFGPEGLLFGDWLNYVMSQKPEA